MAQVKYIRPDFDAQPIRGNVDTRIQKVKRGEFDALIVAEAGLNRLNLANQITERFSLEQFTPSAGQGALAIVAKNGNKEVIQILETINHYPSQSEVTAERSLVLALEGGCRVPIGAIGRAHGERLAFHACVFSLDCQTKFSSSADGKLDDAQKLGRTVAQSLLNQGAKELETEWREKYGTW